MSSGQPENFARNVLWNYLNAAIGVVVGFLVTPLLTHHLGIVKYGVWALVGSLIPYFELLELGFANATVTYVAKHVESGDDDLVHRTLNTSFFVLMVPGVIAAGLAVVLAVFLPDVVHSIPAHLVGQARILLLLLAFDMVVSIPMDTFGGALIALQRYDLLNASLVTVTVLQAIAWFVVLELHGGLVALGAVTIAIGLCGQLARFILLRRLVPGLSVTPRAFDRSILRSFAGLSGWFSLGEISSAVLGGVDVIVVGIVVGVKGAGIYAVGQRIGTLPGKVMTPPTDVLFPYAGQLAGRNDRNGMKGSNIDITRLVFGLAVPCALAVGLLATPAVRAWVGPLYHQSAEVAAILAAAVVIQALALAPRTLMSGAGEPKVSTLAMAAEALLHIGLGIALCLAFGVVGAAVAALVAAVVVDGFVLLPLLYRWLEMKLLRFLFRLAKAHIVPLVVAGAVGWSSARWLVNSFVDHHGRLAGISVAAAAGLAVIIPYWAILLFTGMTHDERVFRWGKIRRRRGGGVAI